ncbi:MAG: phosphonate ABC transporter, permease protein PhnE [Rhodospirillaceae bacterium]|nr:MAG: phosphonate ABC transporter, permease protein PhnE [Rhodospirillaceae bacterium]
MSTIPPSTEPEYKTEWDRPSLIEDPRLRKGLTFAAIVYLLWSMGSLDINWERVAEGLPRAGNIFSRMFPPDFDRWELLSKGIIESLEMAFAATFIGVIIAIPLGLCAAKNLVPRPVYLTARTIIVLTRTLHEVIIAIFFVKIFGFGPLAGIWAVAFRSVGFVGKLIAEAIEEIDEGQVEAIEAAGASNFMPRSINLHGPKCR